MRATDSSYSLISEVILSSSQLHEEDLSDMIIVKKAIFKKALALMSQDQLAALVRETLPSAPIEKGVPAFGKWLEVIYHCFKEQLELKIQSDLGRLIGLSQSDISTLFNRPQKISLSRDRMKEIEVEIQKRISELRATG